MPTFTEVAADPDAQLDVLALALAGELRDVDTDRALAQLDALGEEVADAAATMGELDALVLVLGERHGLRGARDEYDHPDHSMLDLVLERRRGLPIALSVVYVECARRAGIALDPIGLPGHFVVGRLGDDDSDPVLLDPFAGGRRFLALPSPELRPWRPHETALRMLNNLVASYERRNDLGRAIHAAQMRFELKPEPTLAAALQADLRGLLARLN